MTNAQRSMTGVASPISEECPLIPTVCLGDGQLGVLLGHARAFSRSERASAGSEQGYARNARASAGNERRYGRNARGSGRSKRGSGRGEGASSLIEAPVTVGALTLRHKFRGHRSGVPMLDFPSASPETRFVVYKQVHVNSFSEHESRGPVYPSRSECRRRPNNGARRRRCGHSPHPLAPSPFWRGGTKGW